MLDCPDKGFTFSSHNMTCFVLRHHVDGVHTVVCIVVLHPKIGLGQVRCDHGHGDAGAGKLELAFSCPHPSTFGLFGNASINFVFNVAFVFCFHTGNTILGGPPKK